MRSSGPAWLAGGLLILSAERVSGFAGEDLLLGHPWHHEDITERALAGDETVYAEHQRTGEGPVFDPIYDGVGFSWDAADAIAWHADYVDSYLYSPVWWAQGGIGLPQRIKASLVGYAELAKLHFDDTFTSRGMRDNWERYFGGTLVGLYWAALRNDIAAAHHILGVSVHAVQDFYSHSNWVDDPERRCATWYETGADVRNAMPLYAGAYEHAVSTAPQSHGLYSLSCSLLSGDTFDRVLDPICSGISPFQNTTLCEEWRLCRPSTGVTVSVIDRPIESAVRLNPPGIALDTTWLARVQAANRGLVGSDGAFTAAGKGLYFPPDQCNAIIGVTNEEPGSPSSGRGAVCTTAADQVFANTKDLAIRATQEWVVFLGETMAAIGPAEASFWERVRTEGSQQNDREAQFEDFSRLGYQFLSAGPYPVANPFAPDQVANLNVGDTGAGWYLRLVVGTAAEIGAGTDADIYVRLGGVEAPVLLDYLPTTYQYGRTSNPLLAYNDFEYGDHDVYTIGPFPNPPTSLQFENRDAGAGDVLSALWSDFKNSVERALTNTRLALITLIAGNADYVGTGRHYLTATEINRDLEVVRKRMAAGERVGGLAIFRTIRIDGGDEGIHDFTYRLRPLTSPPPSILSAEEKAAGWTAVEVQAWRLHTVAESASDRGTFSDEPFIMMAVAALNGRQGARSHFYMSNPIPDMDSGDVHVFPHVTGSSTIVALPPGIGGLVVSVRVFENDNENQWDREQLLREFATGFDQATAFPLDRFEYELGRFIGADWTGETVKAFGFYRGPLPEAAAVLPVTAIGTVAGGGTSPVFNLDWSGLKPLLASDRAIDSWVAEFTTPWAATPGTSEAPLVLRTGAGPDALTVTLGGVSVSSDVLMCSRRF